MGSCSQMIGSCSQNCIKDSLVLNVIEELLENDFHDPYQIIKDIQEIIDIVNQRFDYYDDEKQQTFDTLKNKYSNEYQINLEDFLRKYL